MTLADLTNLSSEQLAGIGAALAAVGAAALSAWKQKQKPDATDSEKAGFGTVVRLHHSDRVRVDDLGEKIGDLPRKGPAVTQAILMPSLLVKGHAASLAPSRIATRARDTSPKAW